MKFLYFLIGSGVLIGLMLLVRTLFRKQIAPGMLYALWLIPLIRLLIPFGFFEMPVFGTVSEMLCSPYEALAEAGELWTRWTDEEPENRYGGLRDLAEPSGALEEQSHATLTENKGQDAQGTGSQVFAHMPGTQPEEAELSQKPDRGIGMAFAVLWLCGSGLLGGYAALSNRRLKREIRRMEEAHTDCPLPVCVSDAVVSPCLFGLFRPCILVNRAVTEDPTLYHYVLAHELTHYRQKDHVWTFFRILLRVVYWWNPLVWLAASCAAEDAELSCDAKVIRGLSADERKAYGYSLLCLLRDARGGGRQMCVATSMSGSKRGIRRRMEGIAAGARTKKKVLFPVCVLLAVAMLYGCGVPSAKSWMKGKTEQPSALESAVDYELSLQDDIQSRLFYYEIYRYGELTQRAVMAYGTLEGASRRRFRAGLTLGSEEPGGPETLAFGLEDEDAATIDIPVTIGEEDSAESYADMLRGRSVLWGDGKKQEVKAGDDLILTADYYQAEEKDSMSVLSCEELMGWTNEETPFSDTYTTVLIHMVFSDQPEEELARQYLSMEYPPEDMDATEADASGADASEAGTPDLTGSEKLAESWADAFESRDGYALRDMMSREAWTQMSGEDGLAVEEDGDLFFGWSSPWPVDYRILSLNGQTAEILYYAWVSDPHVYVWRETLQLAQQDGIWKVNGEELTLLDDITSAEQFYMAYPDGEITGTMMDYQQNGMGEALNQNALDNRESEFYNSLFDPAGAARYLLNIAGSSGGESADESGQVTVSAEELSDTAAVRITFGEDGTTVEVSMIRPYGEDGIWIPQTKNFPPI